LYFIYNEGDSTGKLYLGTKLIAGESSGIPDNISFSDLTDIFIDDSTLAAKQILVYNENTEKWQNADLSSIINTAVSVMTGASANDNGTSGLVPAPQAGDQNKFLRGDGTWQSIPTGGLNYDIKTQAEIDQMIEDGDSSLSHTIFLV
jgi:hypothetical protein